MPGRTCGGPGVGADRLRVTAPRKRPFRSPPRGSGVSAASERRVQSRTMTVVAISAAYGTRSGQIGPALAERLGVPFVDRAIAHRVAGRLDVSIDEAVKNWEPPPRSFGERMMSAFLGADTIAPIGPPPDIVTPEDF